MLTAYGKYLSSSFAAFIVACISLSEYLRHNLGYKQKIQVNRRNQVYFTPSNVSTDTTVIVKD